MSFLLFPCENCDSEINDPLLDNLCINCIPSLPKDIIMREIGLYIYEGNVRMWNGKVLQCQHRIQISRCGICKPENKCEHGKDKIMCGEGTCHGTQRCEEHNIRKSQCVQCGTGKSLCPHKRQKCQCDEGDCNGSQKCPHGRIKSACQDCGGGNRCPHKRAKADCKICKGTGNCIPHNKKKNSCVDCFINPDNFCNLCKGVYIKGCPYYPMCYRCYYKTNPDTIRPTRHKSKQHYINDFLQTNIEMKIQYDKAINGGQSNRKPDWLLDLGSHCIVIECDEKQHINYSDDEKRTIDIFQDLNSRQLVMIRFNPDRYKTSEGYINGCFEFDEKNVISSTNEWENRQKKLLQTIEHYIENIPEKAITITSLFFDDNL